MIKNTNVFQELLNKLNDIESRNRMYECKIQILLAHKKQTEEEKSKLLKDITEINLLINEAEKKKEKLTEESSHHRLLQQNLDITVSIDQEEIFLLKRNFEEKKVQMAKQRHMQENQIKYCYNPVTCHLTTLQKNNCRFHETRSSATKVNEDEVEEVTKIKNKIKELMPTVSFLFDIFGFATANKLLKEFQNWNHVDYKKSVLQHEALASRIIAESILPTKVLIQGYQNIISRSIDLLINFILEY